MSGGVETERVCPGLDGPGLDGLAELDVGF